MVYSLIRRKNVSRKKREDRSRGNQMGGHKPQRGSRGQGGPDVAVAQPIRLHDLASEQTLSFSGRDIENLGHVVSTDARRLIPWGTRSLYTGVRKYCHPIG